MNNIIKSGLSAGLLTATLLTTQAVNALVISPSDCDDFGGSVTCLTGNETATPDVLAAIAAVYPTLDEIYKQDVGGGESGSLSGAYTTSFSNSISDPMDALIEWDGPAVCSDCYVLVKDGNSTPAWYFFDLTSLWNGTDDLDLQDFWPNRGAISHVSLFGDTGVVPAPAISLLLGSGLVMIGLSRRKRVS